MKRLSLSLLITFFCSVLLAQQKLSFSVLGFEQDVFDTSAKSAEYGKKDGNGSWYAIIKVTSNNPDDDITACQFNFGNMFSKVEKHDEALWVYVQRNAKKVTISRPGYHTINQYDLQTTIEAGCVYKMKLTSDRVQQQVVYDVKIQMVKFQTSPAVSDAMVVAYNQSTGQEIAVGVTDVNGIVFKAMDIGKYTYRIISSDNLFYPSEGMITLVSSDETYVENIRLKANFADVALSVADNAEILVNNQSKGRGSWQGRLASGTYVVTTRLYNHRDYQQKLIVTAGVSQNVTLDAPIPIVGTLVVNSTPYETDIFIDGKEYGKAPRIIKDMLIGEHNIVIRKPGYSDFTAKVKVLEHQTSEINGVLIEKSITNHDKNKSPIKESSDFVNKEPLDSNEAKKGINDILDAFAILLDVRLNTTKLEVLCNKYNVKIQQKKQDSESKVKSDYCKIKKQGITILCSDCNKDGVVDNIDIPELRMWGTCKYNGRFPEFFDGLNFDSSCDEWQQWFENKGFSTYTYNILGEVYLHCLNNTDQTSVYISFFGKNTSKKERMHSFQLYTTLE